MQINGVSETEYLQELYNKKKMEEQQTQSSSKGQFDGIMDQLILNCQQTGEETPMDSGTYNSQGFQNCDMANGMPPVPPEKPEDAEETAETTDTDVVSSLQNILDQVSQTMRVNQDSILSTLDELGLSVTDLYDSDNMSLLCNALDEKAGEMGLTQSEDLDSSISSLVTAAEDEKSSLMDSYSISDEELEALLQQIDDILKENDPTRDMLNSDTSDTSSVEI